MSVITDITLPGHEFALGQLITDNEDIIIEMERLVPLGDQLLPFFWVSNGSPEYIEDALGSQSIVESVTQLTEVDDRYLYQVTWTAEVDGVIDALLDTNGAIVEGKGITGNWELRLRFPDHESLSEFNGICAEKEIELEVNSVYNPHVPSVEEQLTPTQWQTLAVALELGYFEIPRQAALQDLADRFEVSEQAVSQRLRRAMKSVVGGLLFESG